MVASNQFREWSIHRKEDQAQKPVRDRKWVPEGTWRALLVRVLSRHCWLASIRVVPSDLSVASMAPLMESLSTLSYGDSQPGVSLSSMGAARRTGKKSSHSSKESGRASGEL